VIQAAFGKCFLKFFKEIDGDNGRPLLRLMKLPRGCKSDNNSGGHLEIRILPVSASKRDKDHKLMMMMMMMN